MVSTMRQGVWPVKPTPNPSRNRKGGAACLGALGAMVKPTNPITGVELGFVENAADPPAEIVAESRHHARHPRCDTPMIACAGETLPLKGCQ